MLTLLASLALAAPLQVRVGGVAGPVVAFVREGEQRTATACNDAGAGADRAPDGIYTCDPVELAGASAAVSAYTGSGYIEGGTLYWGAGGARTAAIGRKGSAAVASTDLSVLSATAGAPVPSKRLVLARVRGAGGGAAPVLALNGSEGELQLACRDDGGFPDTTRNDGEPGCAGFFAGPARVMVKASGAPKDLGAVTLAEGPVAWLTADLQAGASVDPFPLPLAAASSQLGGQGSPGGNPQGGQGGQQGAGQPGGQPGQQAGDPSAAPQGSAAPQPTGAAVQAGDRLGGRALPAGLPWLGLAVVGFGAVAWRARRDAKRGAALGVLRPLPSQPLWAGGPSLTVSAVIRCEAPMASAVRAFPRIAAERRVVLVLPEGQSPPEAVGLGAWVAGVRDWVDVAEAANALQASAGAPVAVLVVGADTLRDPGATAPDAVAKLAAALSPGVWLGVFAERGAPRLGFLAECEGERGVGDSEHA